MWRTRITVLSQQSHRRIEFLKANIAKSTAAVMQSSDHALVSTPPPTPDEESHINAQSAADDALPAADHALQALLNSPGHHLEQNAEDRPSQGFANLPII